MFKKLISDGYENSPLHNPQRPYQRGHRFYCTGLYLMDYWCVLVASG